MHQLSARVYAHLPTFLKNSKNQVWCMTMVLQKHEKNSKNWPEHPLLLKVHNGSIVVAMNLSQ